MPMRCGICCHVALHGQPGQQSACDTGLGGKVGDSWTNNTVKHCGLAVADTAHSSFPHHVHTPTSVCIFLSGGLSGKMEGVMGTTCLVKEKTERPRMVSGLVWSPSGLHPQRGGLFRRRTQWNYLRATLRLWSPQK